MLKAAIVKVAEIAGPASRQVATKVHGAGVHWAEQAAQAAKERAAGVAAQVATATGPKDTVECSKAKSFRIFSDQPKANATTVAPSKPAAFVNTNVTQLTLAQWQAIYPPAGKIFSDQ